MPHGRDLARRSRKPNAIAGIVAFHGTDTEFEEFGLTNDIGYHFGSVATAERRLLMIGGGDWPRGANVRPVLLNIRRPLRLPDLLDWNPRAVSTALADAGVISSEQADATEIIDQEQVATWLHQAGYDAIIYTNATEEGGDSWIVFDGDQIAPWWRSRSLKTQESTAFPLPDVVVGEQKQRQVR